MQVSAFFQVPESLKSRVRRPIGDLIPESMLNRNAIRSRLDTRGGILVSVGDLTTERLIQEGFAPDLQIVDGVERRNPRKKPGLSSRERIIRARNAAGGIDSMALSKLSLSLELIKEDPKLPVRIEIDGEEDLLVLPVLAFFSESTIVAYGQPGEGMVFVNAKGIPRQLSKEILSEIGIFGLL